MTRDQVSRILREMEDIRMRSYEVGPREERRLDREYGRLWAAIEPFATGAVPYTTEAPISESEAAAWASRT